MRVFKAALMTIAVLEFLASRAVGAQARELVRGTVRSIAGDSIPNARVRARVEGADTTVRADFRGRFAFLLPRGAAHLTATMLGFTLRIDVTGADTLFRLQLKRLVQQIAEVSVRADAWIGIRGVVGDEQTMEPLAGVLITSMKRDVRVVTDSLGRFSFPLPKAELSSLQLSQAGYVSRPAMLRVKQGDTSSLVLLMRRGEDPTHLRFALSDLSHRMAWAGMGTLVANRTQLSRYGARTLEDGIFRSGLLSQRGIVLTQPVCLFVNGEAQPNRPLWSIDLASVDFVEVWGRNTEQFGSFQARWPGGRCGAAPTNQRGGGPWVSVWLLNQ
jgi:hypothetical protein